VCLHGSAGCPRAPRGRAAVRTAPPRPPRRHDVRRCLARAPARVRRRRDSRPTTCPSSVVNAVPSRLRDPALAVVIAAIVVRVFDLGRRSLWLDEAWAAVGSLDGPFDVAHVRHTPFLFAALVRLSVAVLGRSEIAVRLPATLFSIGAVVLAWRLGR